ncbi:MULTISPECIES: hypothetical protein [Halostella]|uniref:hypothetical protein n=1 Tax=Halostella TaxID=1843185 RepID=UPI001080AA7D|nr:MULTISPECIES: hypothetical protein [Halostella]
MDNRIDEHGSSEEAGDNGSPPKTPFAAMTEKAVAAAVTFAATGAVVIAVRKIRRRRRSA